MAEQAQKSVFSRLKRPALMVAGALSMVAVGAAGATWVLHQKSSSSEEKPSVASDDPHEQQAVDHQSEPHNTAPGDPEIDAGHEPPDHSDPPVRRQMGTSKDHIAAGDEANNALHETHAVSPLSRQSGHDTTDLGSQAEDSPDHSAAAVEESFFGAEQRAWGDADGPGPAEPELTEQEYIANLMTNADEKLRGGNYERALRDYQYIRQNVSGHPGAPLLFRMALCAELDGNVSEALEAWRQMAANRSWGKWADLATLGEARCLVALRRYDVLQTELLRRVLLDPSDLLPLVRAELLHLISRSQWAVVSAQSQRHLLNDLAMVVPVWHPEPNEALDQAVAAFRESYPVSAGLQLTILRSEGQPENTQLTIDSAAGPADKLLTAVLERCQFPCQLSAQAQQLMLNRTLQVHVNDQRLSLILDGMTIPFGTQWQFINGVIRVSATEERPAADVDSFRTQAAERLLNAAIREAGQVRHLGHTRVALGSLLFGQSRLRDAADVFRVQLESEPGSDVETESAFNLGKCLLGLGNVAEARDAFLLSVDSALNLSEVRIAAYLYVARLQIEQGNPKPAVSTLLRAVSISQGTSLEGDAALLLASGYLLQDNAQRCSDVLMERRDLLRKADYQKTAAFASSFARYQAVLLEDQKEREAAHLVAAVSHFQPDQQFGAHWFLLYAEAAEQLGLVRQAQDACVRALSQKIQGPIRNQIVLKLAASYRANDRFEESRTLLASLSPEESGQFASMALLRAAEVSLQLGQTTEAIRHCRQLLKADQSAEIQRATLRIMGHAFEREGNHLAAVQCFSGTVPSDSAETQPASQSSGNDAGNSMLNRSAPSGSARVNAGGTP